MNPGSTHRWMISPKKCEITCIGCWGASETSALWHASADCDIEWQSYTFLSASTSIHKTFLFNKRITACFIKKLPDIPNLVYWYVYPWPSPNPQKNPHYPPVVLKTPKQTTHADQLTRNTAHREVLLQTGFIQLQNGIRLPQPSTLILAFMQVIAQVICFLGAIESASLPTSHSGDDECGLNTMQDDNWQCTPGNGNTQAPSFAWQDLYGVPYMGKQHCKVSATAEGKTSTQPNLQVPEVEWKPACFTQKQCNKADTTLYQWLQ